MKVAVLPSGAKNIFIEELKPSTNTLAIADQSEKKFYLNEDQYKQIELLINNISLNAPFYLFIPI